MSAPWLRALLLPVLVLLGTRSARSETSLSLTVIGDARDSRAAAVDEAVTFWNRELEQIGAGVRLGPVRFADDGVTEHVLQELSAGRLRRPNEAALSALLQPIPGEVIVALSDADLMSFGMPWSARAKGFVALRRGDEEPLSLPNVARNAAAHELGHVLGLDHNGDPATLMCGRPAPCRPYVFASSTPRFFPLTAEEQRRLIALWPR